MPGLSGDSWRLHLLAFPAFKATTVSLPFCCRSACPCPMTLIFPFVGVAGCVLSVQQLLAGRQLTDGFWLLGGALGSPAETLSSSLGRPPLTDRPAACWILGGDREGSEEVLATLSTIQGFLSLVSLQSSRGRQRKPMRPACLPASESGARLTGPGSALGHKAKDLSNLRPSSTA